MNTQTTVDRIELWLAPVAATYAAAQLAAYEGLLDAEERTRWQRFHYAADRQRFLVGRAFMRNVLAANLGRDPGGLLFTRTPHGKPELAGEDAGKLHFNLSHTDAMLVLALSSRHEVGVDVEAVTRKVEMLALAERYFSAQEYGELLGMDGAAQRERFFALWTLKEAWVKARGLGLRIPLDAFRFDFAGAHPVVAFSPQLDAAPQDWQFRLLTHAQCRIALAVHCAAAQPLQLRLREWSG